jgi:hypothetical protein
MIQGRDNFFMLVEEIEHQYIIYIVLPITVNLHHNFTLTKKKLKIQLMKTLF